MPDETGPFEWVGKLARLALIGASVLLALMLIVTVAVTVGAALETEYWASVFKAQWLVLPGCVLAIIAEIVAGVLAFVLYGLVKLLVSYESAAGSIAGHLARMETFVEDQNSSVRKLTELASLSDRSKSLIFRDRELEALREVIHEDLIRQDYHTAEALINTIEKDLGYADEAARLREEVAASRKATFEEKIDAAINRIQTIIDRHDWARATRESQRILQLFPNNPKVASLPQRIRAACNKHKLELLQKYGEAVRKDDVDASIELLKELDLYLTPQEGAALAESARGVFKARLHQLGVQFAIRVTEEQWAESITAGEVIIGEYPNSRMAHEVRSKMDLLRARAAAVSREE